MGLAKPTDGLSAQRLLEFYTECGPSIFSQPRGRLSRLFGPKFESRNLQDALERTFGVTTLSEALVEVLVTSYDIVSRRPLCLSKTYDGSEYQMCDVALATSAAPTFFAPVELGEHLVIDGGIIANNPCAAAYTHAKRLWPNEEILVLSIGTGRLERALPRTKASRWGEWGWVKPLIGCLFDGTSKTTHDFFSNVHGGDYLRLQTSLTEQCEDFDNVTPGALADLKTLGFDYADNHRGIIEGFIERLHLAGMELEADIQHPPPDYILKNDSLAIYGMVRNRGNKSLYVFTGQGGNYWPARVQICEEQNRWNAEVYFGDHSHTATISLVMADRYLTDYVEFFLDHHELAQGGIRITTLPDVIASVRINYVAR